VGLVREGPRCRCLRRGPLTFIVYGDVIGREGPLASEEVLQRYVAAGSACVDDLDGAFALVALHSDERTVLVATDRLNGLKCFVEETADAFHVVSSLRFLPRRSRSFDRVAMVSFLSNAAVYGGRTVFEDVRVLARASLHVVSHRGVSSSTYHAFRFDGAASRRHPTDLRDELRHVLLAAVARRCVGADEVYLSLSGGNDSTALLGCLTHLGHEGVRCFSYAELPNATGSDAAVALRVAATAGVEHRVLPAFDGDLDRFLDRNVELGECRANLCLEIDAWDRLRNEVPRNALVLTGDSWFGWSRDDELPTAAAVLAAVPIFDSGMLRSSGGLFDLGEACASFDDERHRLISEASHANPHDTRDYLVLDQRLCHLLLPWRELFPGLLVRNPFLDREVLEFVTRLPLSYRLGERLFKETVYDICPELFGIERASYAGDPWGKVIIGSRSTVEAELRAASAIDRWVSPQGGLELLASLVDSRAFDKTGRAGSLGVQTLARNGTHGHFPRPAFVSPFQLLLRILTLRRFAGLQSPDRCCWAKRTPNRRHHRRSGAPAGGMGPTPSDCHVPATDRAKVAAPRSAMAAAHAYMVL